MDTSDALYDAIYKNAKSIPGYARYYRYLRHIKRNRRPLEFLSDAEETYWAMRVVAEKVFGSESAKFKALDLGSGLGYVTYALNKAGYPTVGVDLSASAVEQARAAFGDYFSCENVLRAEFPSEQFRLVIANQLIEHLLDPKQFIRDVMDKFSNCYLLVTTPNKGIYPDDALWETDLPPVHLWWFCESSMAELAGNLGLEVEFVDFSERYASHPRWDIPFYMTRAPVFDADYRVIARESFFTAAKGEVRLHPAVKGPYDRLKAIINRGTSWKAKSGDVLAPIFRKMGTAPLFGKADSLQTEPEGAAHENR